MKSIASILIALFSAAITSCAQEPVRFYSVPVPKTPGEVCLQFENDTYRQIPCPDELQKALIDSQEKAAKAQASADMWRNMFMQGDAETDDSGGSTISSGSPEWLVTTPTPTTTAVPR